MKVLLKEDIQNVGLAGEVKNVANGFGRNYLLPRGLAVNATPSAMKQADTWRMKAEALRAQERAEYEVLSAKIAEVTLEFTAKAGETGKLYGSITTSDMAEQLNAVLGTEIDRRKIEGSGLRQLGEHKVMVRLDADFQPEFTVVVLSEDGVGVVVVVDEAVEDDTADDDDFDSAE
jgi:large subunit ribosomal protein L9